MQTETKQGSNSEPLFYSPKSLNLIASITSVFSWFVLVAFLGDVIAQGMNISQTLEQQGLGFNAELLSQPSALSFFISSLSTPLFTGVALFLLMQGVSVGLNVLMELDMKGNEIEEDDEE